MSTVPDPTRPGVPREYLHLVDDAAIFPPGDAPLPRAVSEHRRHATSGYAALLGAFVVSDVRLPDLVAVLRDERSAATPDPGPLDVSVVVTGGAGAIEPAVLWAGRADGIALRGIEVALRDEADLAHNARRMTTAVDRLVGDGHLDDEVSVYVEPPRPFGASPGRSPGAMWLAALDEVAAMDLRVKFRTGGPDADALPTATELATCIGAALDRELPFKCTAGLHHAVHCAGHGAGRGGTAHHGFLNVLLATRASLDGASTAEVAELLAEADRAVVTGRVHEAGADLLVSARRWFTSFGSCSVREPLQDLVDLGLLSDLDLLADLARRPA